MKRGDITVVAQRGLYEGKPRPAVLIQLDDFVDDHPTVLVCQISSDRRSNDGAFYRVPLASSVSNGLREQSTVMIDRIVTISRDNIRDVIGTLDPTSCAALDRALGLFLGLL